MKSAHLFGKPIMQRQPIRLPVLLARVWYVRGHRPQLPLAAAGASARRPRGELGRVDSGLTRKNKRRQNKRQGRAAAARLPRRDDGRPGSRQGVNATVEGGRRSCPLQRADRHGGGEGCVAGQARWSLSRRVRPYRQLGISHEHDHAAVQPDHAGHRSCRTRRVKVGVCERGERWRV